MTQLARLTRSLALLVALASTACGDGGAAAAGAGSAAESAGAAAQRPDGRPARAVIAMARGIVEVPGGLIDVAAPLDGIVESVAVTEGAAVRRGEVLLQLSSEPLREALTLAEAELRLARVRQQAQRARVPAAADLARRTAEAARAEAVDAQLADDAERARREAEASLSIARAETAVAEAKVTTGRRLVARLSVRAPEDASVVRLQVRVGARVEAQGGKPLLTLLPAHALRLRTELNEAYLSRVTLGMRASVYLDGDAAPAAAPRVLPGAKVVRLSPLFGSGRLDDEAQLRGQARVVDCFLEFEQAPDLRVGQKVRVEFHE